MFIFERIRYLLQGFINYMSIIMWSPGKNSSILDLEGDGNAVRDIGAIDLSLPFGVGHNFGVQRDIIPDVCVEQRVKQTMILETKEIHNESSSNNGEDTVDDEYYHKIQVMRQDSSVLLSQLHIILHVSLVLFDTSRGFVSWVPFMYNQNDPMFCLFLEDVETMIHAFHNIRITKKTVKECLQGLVAPKKIHKASRFQNCQEFQNLVKLMGYSIPFRSSVFIIDATTFQSLCKYIARYSARSSSDTAAMRDEQLTLRAFKTGRSRRRPTSPSTIRVGYTWSIAHLNTISSVLGVIHTTFCIPSPIDRYRCHIRFDRQVGFLCFDDTIKSAVPVESILLAHGPNISSPKVYSPFTILRHCPVPCWDDPPPATASQSLACDFSLD